MMKRKTFLYLFQFLSLLILICFLLPGLIFSVQAADCHYYVDSLAGSDSNLGFSETSAWRTLTPVNNYAFLPGEVICFKRGSSWTGNLMVSRSGSQDKPIVYQAYGTGNLPMIENPGTNTRGIIISGSWNIIQDFLIRDVYRTAVDINSGADHNVVRNIEATNVGAAVMIDGQYNLVTQNFAPRLFSEY